MYERLLLSNDKKAVLEVARKQRTPEQKYKELQNQLSSGWNTWKCFPWPTAKTIRTRISMEPTTPAI
ncbi:hypothetical protein D0T87_24430 [Bacteroides sp. 51]|nr:hypothetical protein [Bacteroides sp. 51]